MGQGVAQAQLLKKGGAVRQVGGHGQGRGCDRHVMARENLAGPVIVAIQRGLGIWLQRLQQRIISPLHELSEGSDRSGAHGARGFWPAGFSGG